MGEIWGEVCVFEKCAPTDLVLIFTLVLVIIWSWLR